MIRTNDPAKGKGVWIDPPADVLEEARTGTLLGVAVTIVEVLEEEEDSVMQ